MRPTHFWIVATCLVTMTQASWLAAAESADANSKSLLRNGDFGRGQEGWVLTHTKDANTAKWNTDGGEGRHRCFEAVVTRDLQKLQQDLSGPLSDDRLYELSADVKCDTDDTTVSFSTASGYGVTRGFVSGTGFATGQWVRLSIKAMGRNDKEDGGRSYKVIIDWSNRALGEKAGRISVANVQLKEIGRLDLSQDANSLQNLLVNGDFEKGLANWEGARAGGFEISEKGFDGNGAVLKADKVEIHGGAQRITVPNEDALYRLSLRMRPENTEGGKYYIGVMFVFCDIKGRPCGYYFLPLPSKEEGKWLDKTCWFYAEKLPLPKDPNGAAKQMQVKIDFYSNPAKEETREAYGFDNIRLVRMEKAMKQ